MGYTMAFGGQWLPIPEEPKTIGLFADFDERGKARRRLVAKIDFSGSVPVLKIPVSGIHIVGDLPGTKMGEFGLPNAARQERSRGEHG